MKKGPNNGKLLLLIECSIFKIVFRKHQYTGVGASNMCNQLPQTTLMYERPMLFWVFTTTITRRNAWFSFITNTAVQDEKQTKSCAFFFSLLTQFWPLTHFAWGKRQHTYQCTQTYKSLGRMVGINFLLFRSSPLLPAAVELIPLCHYVLFGIFILPYGLFKPLRLWGAYIRTKGGHMLRLACLGVGWSDSPPTLTGVGYQRMIPISKGHF